MIVCIIPIGSLVLSLALVDSANEVFCIEVWRHGWDFIPCVVGSNKGTSIEA